MHIRVHELKVINVEVLEECGQNRALMNGERRLGRASLSLGVIQMGHLYRALDLISLRKPVYLQSNVTLGLRRLCGWRY